MMDIQGSYGKDLTGQVTFPPDRSLRKISPSGGGPVADVYIGGQLHVGNQPPMEVGVKIIRKNRWHVEKSQTARAAAAMELIRESDKWLRLSHKNIQPYFGHCIELPDILEWYQEWYLNVALISPYCRNRDVIQYIGRYIQRDAVKKLKLVTDVISGLEYLHSMDIVHGHLIPNNVLVDNVGNARLADFGQAQVLIGGSPRWSSLSARFMAPELMPLSDEANQDNVLTQQSDIYAFAMLAFQMFTGEAPYQDEIPILTTGQEQVRSKVMRPIYEGMRPHRSSDKQGCISDTVWTIMEHCWDHEPARRPLAAEVAFCMRNEHSSAALGLTPMAEQPPEPLFFLIDLVPVEG